MTNTTDAATTLINLRAFLEILGLGNYAEKLVDSLNLDDITAALKAQAARDDAALQDALDKFGVDTEDSEPGEQLPPDPVVVRLGDVVPWQTGSFSCATSTAPKLESWLPADNPDEATAVDIRIVEQIPDYDGDGRGAKGVVLPNALYLNGQKLLIPKDSEITVGGLNPKEPSCVAVTLTVWARSIQVGAERKPDGSPRS
ncbi:hypothetical protein [Prescottella agglutinans]|uniref:Uncharacterized protein n=1 Tax=Prescottella agglutinans TaxID=1644129 RepID=A0ABT6MES5_9NOCA|nr:hypothetical protein [Prescottella agglutinans]MDH6282823.1 hypothetical protein [Prescottella agglutinans]